MILIGIDPGKGGGVAWASATEQQAWDIHAAKMPPTERDICDLLASLCGDCRAVIEHVGPGQGKGQSAAWKLSASYHGLRMALIALGISFETVHPGVWQREFSLLRQSKTETDTQKKNRHKARAQELFPAHRITHATADALLILEWARRHPRAEAAAC